METKEVLDSTIKAMISNSLIECSKMTSETLSSQRKLLDKLVEIESSIFLCF